jgi:hypothetical protein
MDYMTYAHGHPVRPVKADWHLAVIHAQPEILSLEDVLPISAPNYL